MLEKELTNKQTPPPRPPKPTTPRSPKPDMTLPPEEIYDVPIATSKPIPIPKAQAKDNHLSKSKDKLSSSASLEAVSRSRSTSNNSATSCPNEELYDIPSGDIMPEDIYDVPRNINDALHDQNDEIYDVPKQLSPTIHQIPDWENNRLSVDESSRSSSGVSSELSGSRPGSDSSEKCVSNLVVNNSHDVEGQKRGSAGSGGKRASGSSTGSGGKGSSEDDDYVDYQEIYGYGRNKPVNLYDVPAQVGERFFTNY